MQMSPEERLRSGEIQRFSEILEKQASEITALSLGKAWRPLGYICKTIIIEAKFLTKVSNGSCSKGLHKIGKISL